jgi:hypothetical protein
MGEQMEMIKRSPLQLPSLPKMSAKCLTLGMTRVSLLGG